MSDVSKFTEGGKLPALPLSHAEVESISIPVNVVVQSIDEENGTITIGPETELVENPLANFSDLDPCLCGSGHIWRRCHKQSMIAQIPKDEAKKVQAFLDRRAKVVK